MSLPVLVAVALLISQSDRSPLTIYVGPAPPVTRDGFVEPIQPGQREASSVRTGVPARSNCSIVPSVKPKRTKATGALAGHRSST